jgi:hypothetical protein
MRTPYGWLLVLVGADIDLDDKEKSCRREHHEEKDVEQLLTSEGNGRDDEIGVVGHDGNLNWMLRPA